MADSDIFRVKIDLGNYFSDHKSKAYVSVNRQWKNVRQFHRHITEIFDVKKFVLLTNDGVYLPGELQILCTKTTFNIFAMIFFSLISFDFSQRTHWHYPAR